MLGRTPFRTDDWTETTKSVYGDITRAEERGNMPLFVTHMWFLLVLVLDLANSPEPIITKCLRVGNHS